MNRARHLLTSSLIVIFLFGLGKVSGLVRVLLVANTFGTSTEYDAFVAANQLPELFFTLIAGGALAAAFIPVYSQYLTSAREREALETWARGYAAWTAWGQYLGANCERLRRRWFGVVMRFVDWWMHRP